MNVVPIDREISEAPSVFRDDVIRGLRSQVKIPCKCFYDERGAALFKPICKTPEYYPTRKEIALLEHHAAESPRVRPTHERRAEQHPRLAPIRRWRLRLVGGAEVSGALSYGVGNRWPPAVAHGAIGLSRPLSLSLVAAARRAPRRTTPAVGADPPMAASPGRWS